jgi:hypothetical protein
MIIVAEEFFVAIMAFSAKQVLEIVAEMALAESEVIVEAV